MTREAIHASMVEVSPKGPAAALEAILLKFLDALLRLLADFKAGRLPPLPPGEAAPAEADASRSCPAPGAPAARRQGMLARVWGLVWPCASGVRWAEDAAGEESAAAGGGVAYAAKADRSARGLDRRVTPGDDVSTLVTQVISSPASSGQRRSSNSGPADHGGAQARRTIAPQPTADIDVFTPPYPASRVPPAPARGEWASAKGSARTQRPRIAPQAGFGSAAASRLRDFWRPGGAFFQKSILAAGETGGHLVPE
jgi:hypothetical protein